MMARASLGAAAGLLLACLCTAPLTAARTGLSSPHTIASSTQRAARGQQIPQRGLDDSLIAEGKPAGPGQLAPPTFAGYVPLESDAALYYAYYEAQNASIAVQQRPILLWLQGGPGCASTFGLLYELGPMLVTDDLKLVPNPGAWNRLFGLLIIDQPIGTGYSVAGSKRLPGDTLEAAADLYSGLLGFFEAHPELQERPFIITGESYAGKYVPSIVHYILQVSEHHQQRQQQERQQQQGLQRQLLNSSLQQHRRLPENLLPPNFRLTGAAIGNGFTDPRTQTLAFADSTYGLGLVPPVLRRSILTRQQVVIGLIDEYQWRQAHTEREALLEYIAKVSGVATLMDVRRLEDYDASKAVDRLLNRSDIKALMQADPKVAYESCSKAVGEAMAGDMMLSVRPLVTDVLHHLPLLLYQGQLDAQDGVLSNNAWISALEWHDDSNYHLFNQVHPRLWHVDGHPAGWKRNVTTLTQVVVRNAGHMVPADQPRAAQAMIEEWVLSVVPLTPAPAL